MSEYSMPELSEEFRQDLIIINEEVEHLKRCIIRFTKEKMASTTQEMEHRLVIQQIALAALTAKPVAWGVNDIRCHTHEGAGYFPLYEIPPVPVKQEGEQRD